MSQNIMDNKVDAYKVGIGHMQEKLPNVVQAYEHFTGECFKEGVVSAKNKHLIALGVSLFANNEVCTYYHVDEALAEGATKEEILESVSVSAAIGGGYVMSQGVTRVQQAIERYQP